jgi:hypothetical protein
MSVVREINMKQFRWRIVLSIVNLLMAIGLSGLALNEYRAFCREHPHSDTIVPYMPISQQIVYCLNAPSYVVTNIVGNATAWKWQTEYVLNNVRVSFLVALCLFWWWVGWHLDEYQAKSRGALSVLGWLFVMLLALALAFAGIDILHSFQFPSGTVPGGRAIPIAMVAWGCALVGYCVTQIVRSRAKE